MNGNEALMPEIFESLTAAWNTGTSISIVDAIRGVLAAFVFGQMIAWTYERTYRGLSYSRDFAQTVVLITVSSAVFVMAIGRSVYAGLGLLGVLSMIRFRTTLKTPRDLVFLLGAATSGVASGIGELRVAIIGTLAFSLVALYLHSGPLGARKRFDGILRFRVASGALIDRRLGELLTVHCRRTALMSVGEVAQGSEVEHTYQVKFQSDTDRGELMSALRTELQVRDARLLMQEVTLEY